MQILTKGFIMTDSIGSAVPAQMPQVYPIPMWLGDILNKKVNNVAMSCFERIVHWFCNHFYKAYHEFYIHKTTGTVHKFMDGTLLFDKTNERIAGIKKVQFQNLLPGGPKPDPIDYITLNGKKVLFTTQDKADLIFAKHTFTESVTVENVPDAAGVIKITEQESVRVFGTPAATNTWHVDLSKITSKSYDIVTDTINVPLGAEEIYLVQEAGSPAIAI